MWKEFKEFIVKGNVFDLAIGIIIGGAFGKIVTSLVNDIIMPLVGILTGKIDFKSLKYVISPAQGDMPELAVYYGQFIQNIVDFLLIAFVIFMMIKFINRLRAKQEEEKAAEIVVEPAEDIRLLAEIRDILKSK